jgi:hypothetical protein
MDMAIYLKKAGDTVSGILLPRKYAVLDIREMPLNAMPDYLADTLRKQNEYGPDEAILRRAIEISRTWCEPILIKFNNDDDDEIGIVSGTWTFEAAVLLRRKSVPVVFD